MLTERDLCNAPMKSRKKCGWGAGHTCSHRSREAVARSTARTRTRYHADIEASRAKQREYTKRRRREQGIGPWRPRPPAKRTCSLCGKTFDPPRRPTSRWLSSRRTCSDECAVEKNRQARERAYETTRNKPRKFRKHAPSRRVWFITCDQCDTLFTARTPRAKRCSKACAVKAAAIESREYQRRTRATAIRYWRVDQTPEAQALAKEYYQLRQELRHRGSASK